jgi:hypothetical protein
MVRAVAFMFFRFAWNQQHDVAEVCVVIRLGANWKRFGENFTAVVDVDGVGQLQA